MYLKSRLTYFVYNIQSNEYTSSNILGINYRKPTLPSSLLNNPQTCKESQNVVSINDVTDSDTSSNVSLVDQLVVLFSEKGRCHFCRLLCPDVQVK